MSAVAALDVPSSLVLPIPITSAVEDQVNMLFLWVLLFWLLGVSIYRSTGTIRIYLRSLI